MFGFPPWEHPHLDFYALSFRLNKTWRWIPSIYLPQVHDINLLFENLFWDLVSVTHLENERMLWNSDFFLCKLVIHTSWLLCHMKCRFPTFRQCEISIMSCVSFSIKCIFKETFWLHNFSWSSLYFHEWSQYHCRSFGKDCEILSVVQEELSLWKPCGSALSIRTVDGATIIRRKSLIRWWCESWWAIQWFQNWEVGLWYIRSKNSYLKARQTQTVGFFWMKIIFNLGSQMSGKFFGHRFWKVTKCRKQC